MSRIGLRTTLASCRIGGPWLALGLLLTMAGPARSAHVYSIPDKGPAQHATLRARGLDLIGHGPSGRLLVVAEESDAAWLSGFGAPAVVYAREGSSLAVREKDLDGAYADYHTYAETQAALQALAASYPDLCELQSMGTSFEGRDLPVLRITNLTPAKAMAAKPEVLIFGNLHARELMSVEIPLRFAQYLLENYGSDAQVTQWVDTRDLYVAPMMNPDGHVYVEDNNSGDWWTWWRKNRRPNGDGTVGVDLNRNFSYEWGHDDVGSSPFPAQITYRGPSPLSEPETQALEAFCAAHDFVIAFSYHSFSELLLYPWGYDFDYTVDHELFSTLARRLTVENGYLPGNSAEGAIYLANGNSDDWAYGETLTKNSFLCFTVELNSFEEGGFGPVDSYIQPTFDKVLPMNLRLLELADEPRKVLGPVAPVLNPSPLFAAPVLTLDWSENLPDDPNPAVGYAVEEFRDIQAVTDGADADTGLWTRDGFSISTTAFAGSGSYYSGKGDDLAHAITTTVPYAVTPSTQSFDCQMRYDIEIDYDYAYVTVSTDGGLIWRSVPGNITTNDDPNGANRGNGITGTTNGAWVAASFDLSAYLGQTVELRVVYVTDGSVQGDGIWVDELSPVPSAADRRVVADDHPATSIDVSLGAAAVYSYRVRARDLEGDESRWSNIVSLVLDPVTAVDEPSTLLTHLAGNYPNPFNPRTLIDFTVGRDGGEAKRVVLEVYDVAGRRVRTLVDEERPAGVYREIWSGTDAAGRELASGIYLARLSVGGEAVAAHKMTLLR